MITPGAAADRPNYFGPSMADLVAFLADTLLAYDSTSSKGTATTSSLSVSLSLAADPDRDPTSPPAMYARLLRRHVLNEATHLRLARSRDVERLIMWQLQGVIGRPTASLSIRAVENLRLLLQHHPGSLPEKELETCPVCTPFTTPGICRLQLHVFRGLLDHVDELPVVNPRLAQVLLECWSAFLLTTSTATDVRSVLGQLAERLKSAATRVTKRTFPEPRVVQALVPLVRILVGVRVVSGNEAWEWWQALVGPAVVGAVENGGTTTFDAKTNPMAPMSTAVKHVSRLAAALLALEIEGQGYGGSGGHGEKGGETTTSPSRRCWCELTAQATVRPDVWGPTICELLLTLTKRSTNTLPHLASGVGSVVDLVLNWARVRHGMDLLSAAWSLRALATAAAVGALDNALLQVWPLLSSLLEVFQTPSTWTPRGLGRDLVATWTALWTGPLRWQNQHTPRSSDDHNDAGSPIMPHHTQVPGMALRILRVALDPPAPKSGNRAQPMSPDLVRACHALATVLLRITPWSSSVEERRQALHIALGPPAEGAEGPEAGAIGWRSRADLLRAAVGAPELDRAPLVVRQQTDPSSSRSPSEYILLWRSVEDIVDARLRAWHAEEAFIDGFEANEECPLPSSSLPSTRAPIAIKHPFTVSLPMLGGQGAPEGHRWPRSRHLLLDLLPMHDLSSSQGSQPHVPGVLLLIPDLLRTAHHAARTSGHAEESERWRDWLTRSFSTLWTGEHLLRTFQHASVVHETHRRSSAVGAGAVEDGLGPAHEGSVISSEMWSPEGVALANAAAYVARVAAGATRDWELASPAATFTVTTPTLKLDDLHLFSRGLRQVQMGCREVVRTILHRAVGDVSRRERGVSMETPDRVHHDLGEFHLSSPEPNSRVKRARVNSRSSPPLTTPSPTPEDENEWWSQASPDQRQYVTPHATPPHHPQGSARVVLHRFEIPQVGSLGLAAAVDAMWVLGAAMQHQVPRAQRDLLGEGKLDDRVETDPDFLPVTNEKDPGLNNYGGLLSTLQSPTSTQLLAHVEAGWDVLDARIEIFAAVSACATASSVSPTDSTEQPPDRPWRGITAAVAAWNRLLCPETGVGRRDGGRDGGGFYQAHVSHPARCKRAFTLINQLLRDTLPYVTTEDLLRVVRDPATTTFIDAVRNWLRLRPNGSAATRAAAASAAGAVLRWQARWRDQVRNDTRINRTAIAHNPSVIFSTADQEALQMVAALVGDALGDAADAVRVVALQDVGVLFDVFSDPVRVAAILPLEMPVLQPSAPPPPFTGGASSTPVIAIAADRTATQMTHSPTQMTPPRRQRRLVLDLDSSDDDLANEMVVTDGMNLLHPSHNPSPPPHDRNLPMGEVTAPIKSSIAPATWPLWNTAHEVAQIVNEGVLAERQRTACCVLARVAVVVADLRRDAVTALVMLATHHAPSRPLVGRLLVHVAWRCRWCQEDGTRHWGVESNPNSSHFSRGYLASLVQDFVRPLIPGLTWLWSALEYDVQHLPVAAFLLAGPVGEDRDGSRYEDGRADHVDIPVIGREGYPGELEPPSGLLRRLADAIAPQLILAGRKSHVAPLYVEVLREAHDVASAWTLACVPICSHMLVAEDRKEREGGQLLLHSLYQDLPKERADATFERELVAILAHVALNFVRDDDSYKENDDDGLVNRTSPDNVPSPVGFPMDSVVASMAARAPPHVPISLAVQRLRRTLLRDNTCLVPMLPDGPLSALNLVQWVVHGVQRRLAPGGALTPRDALAPLQLLPTLLGDDLFADPLLAGTYLRALLGVVTDPRLTRRVTRLLVEAWERVMGRSTSGEIRGRMMSTEFRSWLVTDLAPAVFGAVIECDLALEDDGECGKKDDGGAPRPAISSRANTYIATTMDEVAAMCRCLLATPTPALRPMLTLIYDLPGLGPRLRPWLTQFEEENPSIAIEHAEDAGDVDQGDEAPISDRSDLRLHLAARTAWLAEHGLELRPRTRAWLARVIIRRVRAVVHAGASLGDPEMWTASAWRILRQSQHFDRPGWETMALNVDIHDHCLTKDLLGREGEQDRAAWDELAGLLLAEAGPQSDDVIGLPGTRDIMDSFLDFADNTKISTTTIMVSEQRRADLLSYSTSTWLPAASATLSQYVVQATHLPLANVALTALVTLLNERRDGFASLASCFDERTAICLAVWKASLSKATRRRTRKVSSLMSYPIWVATQPRLVGSQFKTDSMRPFSCHDDGDNHQKDYLRRSEPPNVIDSTWHAWRLRPGDTFPAWISRVTTATLVHARDPALRACQAVTARDATLATLLLGPALYELAQSLWTEQGFHMSDALADVITQEVLRPIETLEPVGRGSGSSAEESSCAAVEVLRRAGHTVLDALAYLRAQRSAAMDTREDRCGKWFLYGQTYDANLDTKDQRDLEDAASVMRSKDHSLLIGRGPPAVIRRQTEAAQVEVEVEIEDDYEDNHGDDEIFFDHAANTSFSSSSLSLVASLAGHPRWWDSVHWVRVDYLDVAVAALRLGRPATALLYLEQWREEFGFPFLGAHGGATHVPEPQAPHIDHPFFPPRWDRACARFQALLFEAHAATGEPDSLPALPAPVDPESTARLALHAGDWPSALVQAEILRRGAGGNTESNHVAATALAAMGCPALAGSLLRTSQGRISSMTSTSVSTLTSTDDPGARREAMAEVAWRLSQWNDVVGGPGREGDVTRCVAEASSGSSFDPDLSLFPEYRVDHVSGGFHGAFGSALQGLARNSATDVDVGHPLDVARAVTLAAMAGFDREATSAANQSVVRLQMVRVVEDVKHSVTCSDGMAVPASALMHHWRRFEAAAQRAEQYECLESLFAAEAAALQAAGHYHLVPRVWLQGARVAREQGRYLAATSLLEAIRQHVGAPPTLSSSPETPAPRTQNHPHTLLSTSHITLGRVGWPWRLEMCRLLRARGQRGAAITAARSLTEDLARAGAVAEPVAMPDGRTVRYVSPAWADLLSLTGQWLGEDRMMATQAVNEEYLSYAVQCLEYTRQVMTIPVGNPCQPPHLPHLTHEAPTTSRHKRLQVFMKALPSSSAATVPHPTAWCDWMAALDPHLDASSRHGSLDAALCDAHFRAGQWASRVHAQILDLEQSVEYTQTRAVIRQKRDTYHKLEAKLRAATSKASSHPHSDSVTEQRTIMHHMNQLARVIKADDATERATTATKGELVAMAVRAYGATLRTDGTHDRPALFALVRLWFAHHQEIGVADEVESTLPQLPAGKLLPLAYQLASRLGTEGDEADQRLGSTVATVVEQMCTAHPYHMLWHVFAISNGDRMVDGSRNSNPKMRGGMELVVDDTKVRAAQSLLASVRQRGDRTAAIILQMEELIEVYLHISRLKFAPSSRGRQRVEPVPLPGSLRRRCAAGAFHLLPVTTAVLPVDPSGEYHVGGSQPTAIPYLCSFGTYMEGVGGINAPKRIRVHDSHGGSKQELVKSGNDDLRQDAVLQQMFSLINDLLAAIPGDPRHLRVRTYRVVPFTPTAGLVGWVEDTMPLADYLVGPDRTSGAHLAYRPPGGISFAAAANRIKLAQAQTLNVQVLRRVWEEVTKAFPPVMRMFFLSKYGSPSAWMARRVAYTRSVAASSMAGHLLGLGDRHAANILLDLRSAEVVHIDFGIAFEQGRFLNTPELVPFRLTRDMVDGMGVLGTEGPLRACMEAVLRVLRAHKTELLTVMNVFLHDPLLKWALTPSKAKRRQIHEVPGGEGEGEALYEDPLPGSADAARAILRVKQKLEGLEFGDGEVRGVEGQVQQLLVDAQDGDKLVKMFVGWAPWC